jgi:hypothetical protein
MVNGNHEEFAHLERPVAPRIPDEPVRPDDLPAVDTAGHIHLLPSGWRTRLPSGLLVAGVGGIERGQRCAEYHPMAYLEDDAVAHLLGVGAVDLLATHQGPSAVQRCKGV